MIGLLCGLAAGGLAGYFAGWEARSSEDWLVRGMDGSGPFLEHDGARYRPQTLTKEGSGWCWGGDATVAGPIR
jgi:hypothetical protein